MFEITEYDQECTPIVGALRTQEQLSRDLDGMIKGFTWVARDRWVVELGFGMVWHVQYLDV